MKRFALAVAVLVIVPLIATHCLAQAKPGWPKGVTIGAAPLGGVYYIWGGAFAKLMNDKLGVQSNVEATGGPVHNTQLLQTKGLDFGMVTAGPAWEGYNGQEWARGKKHDNLRIIFPMYVTYFQMYALAKTNIKIMNDLKGKSVGVGPKGGTAAEYWPKIFEAAGVKPSRVVNASSADLNSQLKDGMLDANGQALGIPWPTITEVETTNDINTFGVPAEDVKKVLDKYPYFLSTVIPKGTYKSNKDNDIPTVAMWNFMAVHKDTPEDFVYEVVKKTYENLDVLIAAHKSAQEIKAENIKLSPIPIHPGAVKYYKEKGVPIPDNLVTK
jgi:TRAP transporter TAXI family solute receptor